ncbi:MAG: HAD family hydrolase, partial [Sedimenticola sp.]|nr:HAD family hydrolase [Sedimenticola sp.]
IETVVITLNDYTSHEDFTGAALVVDQLGEPENPCQVIKGDVDAIELVDVGLLKQLHGVS